MRVVSIPIPNRCLIYDKYMIWYWYQTLSLSPILFLFFFFLYFDLSLFFFFISFIFLFSPTPFFLVVLSLCCFGSVCLYHVSFASLHTSSSIRFSILFLFLFCSCSVTYCTRSYIHVKYDCTVMLMFMFCYPIHAFLSSFSFLSFRHSVFFFSSPFSMHTYATHIHMHTYTHTHIYIYTYTHMHQSIQSIQSNQSNIPSYNHIFLCSGIQNRKYEIGNTNTVYGIQDTDKTTNCSINRTWLLDFV